MKTHAVTYLKTRSSELVHRVAETRAPVYITQKGRTRAVLVDLQSWEELQESVAMLKLVVHSEEQIRTGRVTPHGRVASELRRRAHR